MKNRITPEEPSRISSDLLRRFAVLLRAGVLLVAVFNLPGTLLLAQTAIGGITPDNSAMLDVQSTNKGVLFPRITTAQRNAISPAATGLMIFNTTTGCLEINLGAGTAFWQSITCTSGLVESLNLSGRTFNNFPIDQMAGATNQSITLPYTGGNGKDYDSQSVPSTGVTGLTATLAAGNFAVGAGSVTYNLSGVPNGYGSAIFSITLGGHSATLEVPMCGALVGVGDFKVFSCYNLGAAGAASNVDPFTPSWELNGDYYQWGFMTKAADGPTDGSTPNTGTFAPGTWNSTAAPDGSWADAPSPRGGQDPCPAGFRVPSKSQWQGVANNNTISDPSGASWTSGGNNYTSGKNFGSALFLPAAGYWDATGAFDYRDNVGLYWSSTESGSSNAEHLLFFPMGNVIYGLDRKLGLSVRCIAE